MKLRGFIYLIVFIAIVLIIDSSCKKKSNCYSTSAIGRIIGFDPCKNYYNSNHVNGFGFVIERTVNGMTDTVVTYGLPDGQFIFQDNFIDGNYSSYLFRPNIQDQYKISFNYQDANASDQTHVLCFGNIYTADFDRAVRGREIFVSCIYNR